MIFRPLCLDPSVMNIKLSNSDLVAQVDQEDFLRCEKITWSLMNSGYAHGNFYGEIVLLHRFVLWIFDDDSRRIDHKDLNKLNCQKDNLRVASPSENGANRKKGRGVSKYKGVSWHNRDSLWRARIKVNYQEIVLGYFKSEEDAARAYNREALYHFGEFARFNSL